MDIDLGLCEKVGISGAMVYAVVKKNNESRGVMFEGHPYSCLSISAIQKELPFLSMKTIQRALQKLDNESLLESKLFVGTTKWRRVL